MTSITVNSKFGSTSCAHGGFQNLQQNNSTMAVNHIHGTMAGNHIHQEVFKIFMMKIKYSYH